MRILIIIMLALTAVPCSARLGETLDQCVARYGPALSSFDTWSKGAFGDKSVTFSKNGYLVVVTFSQNKAVCEFFSKLDKTDLSETEQGALLDLESKGWHFEVIPDQQGNISYLRKDNQVQGTYLSAGKKLVICTSGYVAANEQFQKNIQKTKLNGF